MTAKELDKRIDDLLFCHLWESEDHEHCLLAAAIPGDATETIKRLILEVVEACLPENELTPGNPDWKYLELDVQRGWLARILFRQATLDNAKRLLGEGEL